MDLKGIGILIEKDYCNIHHVHASENHERKRVIPQDFQGLRSLLISKRYIIDDDEIMFEDPSHPGLFTELGPHNYDLALTNTNSQFLYLKIIPKIFENEGSKPQSFKHNFNKADTSTFESTININEK